MKTLSLVVAVSFAALAVLTSNTSRGDERLLGRWIRTENVGSVSYGGGYVGSRTAYTFGFMERGVCTLNIETQVQGTHGGWVVDSGRDLGKSFAGSYAVRDGQISIRLNDGTVLEGAYNVFAHNGQTVFKLHIPGRKPVYYYRQ